MSMSDRIVATIRTGVPALVGLILATLIARIPAVADVIAYIDTELTTLTGGVPVAVLLNLAATAAVIAAYYWVARKLGDRWPWVETWLLGSSLTPVYAPTIVTDVNTGDVSLLSRAQYREYRQALADDADAARASFENEGA